MNAPSSEDKKNLPSIVAVLSASLRPTAPETLRVALSTKQNFALAAEEIFVHALNRTVWSYRESYLVVESMLAEIRNTAMESVATEQGVSRISNMVFGNAVMREFLFSLQVQFFSQFAEFQSHWSELIGNIGAALTNGMIGVDVRSELSLVPDDIRDRTYEAEHMRDLMMANTWLIMFIFIALWGRTYTYDELRATKRIAAAA